MKTMSLQSLLRMGQSLISPSRGVIGDARHRFPKVTFMVSKPVTIKDFIRFRWSADMLEESNKPNNGQAEADGHCRDVKSHLYAFSLLLLL